MRQFLFAKSAVQVAQLVLLRFGQRPAVGPVSEFQNRFDVTGFRIVRSSGGTRPRAERIG